jgi:hypothetical protein
MTANLTVAGLDPEKENFVFQLADRIGAIAEIDDTPEAAQRIAALPEHWRYIEPLVYYFNEVNNGGHHQYFWNSQGAYRHLVADGLRYFKAHEFEQIYREALSHYTPELYEVAHGATWEEYQKSGKADRFDQQDSEFYKVTPKLIEIVSRFVRSNLRQYE